MNRFAFQSIVVFVLISIAFTINVNADFIPEDLKPVVVQVEVPGRERPISQSGILVTSQGHVLTALGDEGDALWGAYDDDATVTIHIFTEEGSRLTFEAQFATDVVERVALLEIIEGENLDALANLPYYNPIVNGGAASGFLQSISSFSYTNIGQEGIAVTEGIINSVARLVTAPDDLPTNYYLTALTIDETGLGGLIVNTEGSFIGLVTLLQDQLAEVMTISSICLENPTICQIILEANRPNPENRARPPSGLWQLTDGIGLTNGGRVSDGQVQLDYYCTLLGMDISMDAAQDHWQCVSSEDASIVLPLEPWHHDIICQQTYRNPEAIAFQLALGVAPAQSWRCYG